MRAEATVNNTSISVSWEWSSDSFPTCVNLVQVRYRPEGGSQVMYTAGSTTAATSATLINLQCNTKYTIWVYVRSGQNGKTSVSRMVFLPSRGMIVHVHYTLCALAGDHVVYLISVMHMHSYVCIFMYVCMLVSLIPRPLPPSPPKKGLVFAYAQNVPGF